MGKRVNSLFRELREYERITKEQAAEFGSAERGELPTAPRVHPPQRHPLAPFPVPLLTMLPVLGLLSKHLAETAVVHVSDQVPPTTTGSRPPIPAVAQIGDGKYRYADGNLIRARTGLGDAGFMKPTLAWKSWEDEVGQDHPRKSSSPEVPPSLPRGGEGHGKLDRSSRARRDRSYPREFCGGILMEELSELRNAVAHPTRRQQRVYDHLLRYAHKPQPEADRRAGSFCTSCPDVLGRDRALWEAGSDGRPAAVYRAAPAREEQGLLKGVAPLDEEEGVHAAREGPDW
ncbi:hypothetical protein QBC46DRAFT_339419 [Diplogelasinospora grovesii]|uniref:Uncharacterized protein n=1 Tax=Diplogelasinospora grovesii TaxID=303347 RepID=A0AAN6S7B1_9PEZI|nr:hypothetical protein QBC46DRAFT_339419 [Diplogelasinospora grovesii]